MSETQVQKQIRLLLEQQAREIGVQIGEACPAGVGYALLVFDFGDDGNLAYVSNANRADMIRALEDLVKRLRAGS